MRLFHCALLGGLFLNGQLLSASPVGGTIINDGSNPDTLLQVASTNAGGDAVLTLAANDFGSLTASQEGDAFFAKRTAWAALNAFPTGAVYTVSAEFQPAENSTPNRGGVMGWLNLATGRGVAFEVKPGEQSSFRLSTIDFSADNGLDNESTKNLFNLDGSAASEDLASAWSVADTYRADAFATFQLEFTAPAPADRQALSNVTAHIFAKVFQAATNDTNRAQIGRTIELLTDLPLPAPENHRLGYFAYWGSVVLSGSTIGYLENLTGTGQVRSIANNPPTVTLVRPSKNMTLPSGSSLTIEAQAADPDGTIRRVEFFFDNILVGTATNTPYETTISDLELGPHPVRVRAVDSNGASAASPTVTVTVQAPIPGEGPRLEIQVNPDGSLLLSWPTGYESLRLEASPSLLPQTWINLSKTSPTSAVIQPSEPAKFFRLAAP